MDEKKISIILVDDHKVLRDGLRALLELDEKMVVVGEAGTGEKAIQIANELNADIIVMDLGLPDMSGLDAIRAIRKKNLKSRIIVLSMHIKREFVLKAIEEGCSGYVPKSSAHTSLLEAIHVVMGGERFLHPKAATALVESITLEQTVMQKLKTLSKREQDVLRLTAMGYTSREIGGNLFISPKTAETYRQRAMEKLDLQRRSELVKFALQAGLLKDFE